MSIMQWVWWPFWALGRLGWRMMSVVLALIPLAIMAGGVGAYGLWLLASYHLPDHLWLKTYQPPQITRIYGEDSVLLSEIFAERRVMTPIGDIPPLLRQAFLSAEDQNFYFHDGVDFIAILRAVLLNIERQGQRSVGASTITQQVAKNMLVGNERTITRKIREAILAGRLEQDLTKDRILEIYLNEVFLGAQSYGVAMASFNYFGKTLPELSLGEMAYLAALPKGPNNYHPLRHPESARQRRDWVVDRMQADGAISAQEASLAKAEAIPQQIRAAVEVASVGQYFTEEVKRDLNMRYGSDITSMAGLVVRSSMNTRLQNITEEALRNGLFSYDRRRGGWRGPVIELTSSSDQWLKELAAMSKVPGMLPSWKMALVAEVKQTEARVMWMESSEAREAPLLFEDVASWARPILANKALGSLPRRMQDVLKPGQVVMVEVLDPIVHSNRSLVRPLRVGLRQIPEITGAIAVLDPHTSRVLALAGGFSYDASVFNRATQALRQPGSSFKPFVYMPAIEAGMPLTQRLQDAPVEIQTDQGVWRPGNYSGSGRGWVSMRSAMESSLNLATIRLAQDVGMHRVSETASRFGVIPRMLPYPSMALGAGETTVLRMAAAYGSFVNGGKAIEPSVIDSIQDRFGRTLWRPSAQSCGNCGVEGEVPARQDIRRSITDPISAYQMVSLLEGVVQRGTGTRAGKDLHRPVAGKTGTSNDYKDNWFVGFTQELAVAVWLGYDDARSLGEGETGGSNAAPIFQEVIKRALEGRPATPFLVPQGAIAVRPETTTERPRSRSPKPLEETLESDEEVPPPSVNQGLGSVY